MLSDNALNVLRFMREHPAANDLRNSSERGIIDSAGGDLGAAMNAFDELVRAKLAVPRSIASFTIELTSTGRAYELGGAAPLKGAL
jgi:hypothetical protein